jgi:hypothetical protein
MAEWREKRQHWGGERDKTTPIGMTQILLGRRIKKIRTVDSAATNG